MLIDSMRNDLARLNEDAA